MPIALHSNELDIASICHGLDPVRFVMVMEILNAFDGLFLPYRVKEIIGDDDRHLVWADQYQTTLDIRWLQGDGLPLDCPMLAREMGCTHSKLMRKVDWILDQRKWHMRKLNRSFLTRPQGYRQEVGPNMAWLKAAFNEKFGDILPVHRGKKARPTPPPPVEVYEDGLQLAFA